jgi:hypothetical protein
MVVVIAALSGNPKALLSFLAATVLVKFLFGEASYGDKFSDLSLSLYTVKENTNYFKVRIDPFLTPALILLACWLGRRRLMRSAVVFVFASVGYFLVDDRATGLILFLSAAVLATLKSASRPKLGQIPVIVLAAVVFGYVGFAGYVNYTLNYNPSGHNGRQLSQADNPYNPINLLVQGRSEWLVMPAAIAERPLFGWGSWAVDTDLRFAYMRAERLGVDDQELSGIYRQVYIPAHSIIGSAWVWSGVLGFAALAWVLHTVVKLSVRMRSVDPRLLPAVVFFTCMILWHIFFSPPQAVRLNLPVGLAALIVLTSRPREAIRTPIRPSL